MSGSNNLSNTIISASTAFSARFDKGVDLAVTDYLKVATVVPSTSATTGYGFLSRFPKAKKWVGERAINRLSSSDYQIKNEKFESTVGIPRDDFEDNDYGKYTPVFEDMGREAAEFPNEHIFSLLSQGFEVACYDGQNFFDLEHPVGKTGEAQSNILINDADNPPEGESWFLLDCSRSLKPLIWQERATPELESKTDAANSDHVFMLDEILYGIRARGNGGFSFWQLAAASKEELNTDNFNALYQMMTKRKDEEKRPMHISPTLLVVPPSLRQQAHDVINKEFNKLGESNINFKIVDVYVCPYL
ncbi:Mu-like prophage major head subunit gpT family protein [Vibrio parahaemolyticus]|uniref:Mu-like prophage major head subunit gpT family protein n=1 Tax=Vibrio parahaemolyticus TaxID=670 RepID=UPI003891748C